MNFDLLCSGHCQELTATGEGWDVVSLTLRYNPHITAETAPICPVQLALPPSHHSWTRSQLKVELKSHLNKLECNLLSNWPFSTTSISYLDVVAKANVSKLLNADIKIQLALSVKHSSILNVRFVYSAGVLKPVPSTCAIRHL